MQGDLVLAAGRVRSKKKNEKKTRKSAASKTHHKIRSSRATVTTSRRRAMKYVPRVSPCSPAPVDPWFVEIGLVQLPQSGKTTNVIHTQADGHTDRLIKEWHPVRTPLLKKFLCVKEKIGPIDRKEVDEARRPRTCSSPCAFEGKKTTKKEK